MSAKIQRINLGKASPEWNRERLARGLTHESFAFHLLRILATVAGISLDAELLNARKLAQEEARRKCIQTEGSTSSLVSRSHHEGVESLGPAKPSSATPVITSFTSLAESGNHDFSDEDDIDESSIVPDLSPEDDVLLKKIKTELEEEKEDGLKSIDCFVTDDYPQGDFVEGVQKPDPEAVTQASQNSCCHPEDIASKISSETALTLEKTQHGNSEREEDNLASERKRRKIHSHEPFACGISETKEDSDAEDIQLVETPCSSDSPMDIAESPALQLSTQGNVETAQSVELHAQPQSGNVSLNSTSLNKSSDFLYDVKFLDDGVIYTCPRNRIRPKKTRLYKGDKVMCKWTDGNFYKAQILSVIQRERCKENIKGKSLKKPSTSGEQRPIDSLSLSNQHWVPDDMTLLAVKEEAECLHVRPNDFPPVQSLEETSNREWTVADIKVVETCTAQTVNCPGKTVPNETDVISLQSLCGPENVSNKVVSVFEGAKDQDDSFLQSNLLTCMDATRNVQYFENFGTDILGDDDVECTDVDYSTSNPGSFSHNLSDKESFGKSLSPHLTDQLLSNLHDVTISLITAPTSSDISRYAEENSLRPSSRPNSELEEYQENMANESTFEESIIVLTSNNSRGTRIWDKRHYCLYCNRPQAKIARHYFNQHMNETNVATAANETNPKKRLELLTQLRNLGNHKHNSEVLKSGKGILIVAHRPRYTMSYREYEPCQHCFGYYARKELWRHKCNAKPRTIGKPISSKNSQMYAPGTSRTILNSLKNDEISSDVRNDKIMSALVQEMSVKYGENSPNIHSMLRLISQLLSAVRDITGMHFAPLETFFDSKYFHDIVNATENISGFVDSLNEFGMSSMEQTLAETLKNYSLILRSTAIEEANDALKNRAEAFLQQLSSTWLEIPSVTQWSLDDIRKYNRPKLLPTTKDNIEVSLGEGIQGVVDIGSDSMDTDQDETTFLSAVQQQEFSSGQPAPQIAERTKLTNTQKKCLESCPENRKRMNHLKIVWTKDEKNCVLENFSMDIASGKLPGKAKIMEVIRRKPILHRRKWQNVKDCVRNILTSKKYKDYVKKIIASRKYKT